MLDEGTSSDWQEGGDAQSQLHPPAAAAHGPQFKVNPLARRDRKLASLKLQTREPKDLAQANPRDAMWRRSLLPDRVAMRSTSPEPTIPVPLASFPIGVLTIGMLGSFVIASALVPQMYKVYKTKSAKDISMAFQCLYILGVAMILVYGFGESLWPIYIPASIEELAAVVMLGMKLFYDRRPMKLSATGVDDTSELELGLADRALQGPSTKFDAILSAH
ncbi:hypothetical protein BBJ28_00021423 [Nothophytophthora sp. Chile5]|nr:hypothetical protein BBJ28_00021423 [Nothophytophthora sp. Chile5]